MKKLSKKISLYILAVPTLAIAVIINVNPGDEIQSALDSANPGDTVKIHAGTYEERLNINNSGSSGGGYITLMANPGDDVYLSGGAKSSTSDPNMIYGSNPSYIKIIGLNICSNVAKNASVNGSGILIEGHGDHIEILNNKIYEMRCKDGKNYGAMGIGVYGTDPTPFSNFTIANNEIFNCEPADSEAMNFDGNVTDFMISNNYVHDVNNIGICMIGGESNINPTFGTRNGVCAENIVKRARSSYGGGYGAAIYSDGGQNIIIERNEVSESDLGIECGVENGGWISSNIIVRNNLIYYNDKIGIGFGGYDAARGRVIDSQIINNTFYKNNELSLGNGDFHGEIVIAYSTNITFKNNIVYISEKGDKRTILDENPGANINCKFDFNLYFCDSAPANYGWKEDDYSGFSAYTNAVYPNELYSIFSNPEFMDIIATNLDIINISPAVNTGTNLGWVIGDIDFAGNPRINMGMVDIGAYESVPEPGMAFSIFITPFAWLYSLFGWLCLRKFNAS